MSPSEDSPAPSGASQSTGAPAAGLWKAPSPEEVQKLLQGYEVLELIGRGGMGAVYKARQTSLDRMVAIKILPPTLWDNEVDYAERFRQEARVMAKLMHPGMIAVFDFGETLDGKLYFVMEYVEGTDVSRMLLERGHLTPEHALAITAHVCDTLRYAHDKGVIHRDIKPANVMVDVEGKVKVADFGLAKLIAQEVTLTRSTVTMGTPDFVAPEALIEGVAVDGRADLYSLGVMLYEMLTGKLPRGVFTLPSRLVAGLDPRFDEIVNRAMQAEPDARYASAAEFRQHLDHILTVPAAEYQRQQTLKLAAAAKSGRAGLWIVLACVALAGGAGIWFATTGSETPQSSAHPDSAEAKPGTNPAASASVAKTSDPSAQQSSAQQSSAPLKEPEPKLPPATPENPTTTPAPVLVATPPPAAPPVSSPPPAESPSTASPASARPSDPAVAQHLQELEEKYLAAVKRDVTAKRSEQVTKLDTQYLAAIDRSLAAVHVQAEGNPLLKEKERVTNRQPLPQEEESDTPASLKNLRATYRSQLAKIDAERLSVQSALRDKLRQVLAGYQLELTKAGNSAGAKVVGEKIQDLIYAEASPNVPLAEFEIEKAEWQDLRKDALVFTDSPRYKWVIVPDFFEGFQFARAGKRDNTLRFKVTREGMVFMVCTSRWMRGTKDNDNVPDLVGPSELEAAGWKPLGIYLKSNESFTWPVYYRRCRHGEQFAYRTEKYARPFLVKK